MIHVKSAFILSLLLGFVPGVCRAQDPAGPEAPGLAAIEAFRSPAGVTVAWRTTHEHGLIAFELLQESSSGQWERVNAEPLSATGGSLGCSYEIEVPGAADPLRCQLVLLDAELRRHALGPFTLAVGAAPEATPEAATSLLAATALAASAGGTAKDATGSLPWIKLSTTVEGIHRVSADALAPLLGITTNQVRDRIAQGTLALLHRGQPVGWLPGTNNAELLFHAEALRNNYTTTNVYWLVDGTNPSPAVLDGAAPAAQTNGWYTNVLNLEQDVSCLYTLGTDPGSNYWFWANLVGSHRTRYKFDCGFVLDALGPTDLLAQLSVRVYSVTTTNHALTLTINGTTNAAWTGTWSGIQPAEFSFTFPSALLLRGSNTLRFTALGTFASQWWLDGAQLDYPRPYVASNGCLLCAANANAVVTLSGFANSNITVLDVTQPLMPLLVSNLAIQSVAGLWSASFVPRQPDARYSVCQPGAANEVAALEAVWPVGLASPTNRAALVIIAPSALLAAAQPLADYRNQQGLETKLVTLDSVYNEFNGGIREPEAIRSFLAYAWGQWRVGPTYALLIGNGTYDYRNLLGNGDNLVPPLMIPSLYGLVASDSEFGQVTNVPGPQIAVGRLPAINAVQLSAMITKIKAYEAAPSVGKAALLMADIPDAGNDFVASITNVQATLAGSFTNTLILPGDTATMRSLLLSNLNAGKELFCYMGHGASDRFGSAGYLTTADVATLTNGNRLPLVAAMTCLSGFFAEPGYDCLSEALVLAAKPGAIAVLSASGYSLNDEATELNLGLMEALVSGAPGRLGDFVRQAMTNYNQVTRWTPSGMYNILGDPALLYRAAPAPPPLPPLISALSLNGNGTLTLTLSAQPGYNYTLVAATNVAQPLASWPVLSTGTVPFGPFAFTDLTATDFAQRFYRLATRSQ